MNEALEGEEPPSEGRCGAGLRENGDWENRENWVPRGLGRGGRGPQHQSSCSRNQLHSHLGMLHRHSSPLRENPYHTNDPLPLYIGKEIGA